jgi:hypothetical protein
MGSLPKTVVGVATTGILAYALLIYLPQIQKSVSARDSLAYWSAARLLIHHRNPYDFRAVLDLERQHGYGEERPLILRTPPWSLCMVLPLGFLNPVEAWLLWTVIAFSCLVVGMRLCRKLYGGNSVPQNLFSIIGYTFAPVPACLVSGQMGLVLMLGVVLFFWWEGERPFLAGAVLILPFAKPHLLSLFWVAILLWVMLRKKHKIALGFATALTTAVLLPLLFDPHVFQHYRGMLRTASIGNEFIPALSGVIRILFFRHLFWVQFVPLALGLAWGIWFFLARISNWIWWRHAPALLIVSVLTTPYAWLADETVLLPAILQAAAFVYQARADMKVRNKLALSIFALLNALLLLILRSKIPFATGIYFWSSLVWFSWYFYSCNFQSSSPSVR